MRSCRRRDQQCPLGAYACAAFCSTSLNVKYTYTMCTVQCILPMAMSFVSKHCTVVRHNMQWKQSSKSTSLWIRRYHGKLRLHVKFDNRCVHVQKIALHLPFMLPWSRVWSWNSIFTPISRPLANHAYARVFGSFSIGLNYVLTDMAHKYHIYG